MSEVDLQSVFNAPRAFAPSCIAAGAIALILVAVWIWAAFAWKEPRQADVTYRLIDLKERGQAETTGILTSFEGSQRCIARGVFVERDGTVSLEYQIPDGPETDTPLGCLKRDAPDGFVFARIGN